MLLFEPLLSPKPSASAATAAASTSFSARHPLFQAPDLLSLKKREQGAHSWIRVDAATGQSQVIEVDKFTMMRRCDLPARDLRLLDPLFVYPSTILGREKAIVVNLEQIRCIITADEVLLLNSLNGYVIQYVVELQRRLVAGNNSVDGARPDYLPFEFRALEVALEASCTFLDAQPETQLATRKPKKDQALHIGSSSYVKELVFSITLSDLLDIEALEVALRSGKLQAHSVETGIAIITDGGVTLKIDTKLLTNLSLRIDSIYQFIGELQIQSENDAILQARVGRNIDGIDLNLYYQTMKLCRKLEEEIGRSRTK